MKPWYKSKTIWFNSAAAALAAVVASFESLRALMAPEHFAVASVAIGAANVWLRTVTTMGLSTDKE